MKTQFTLRIEPKEAPSLKKKCSRCSCEIYYCSKKFRVNANKKNIDVWVIYKCMNCDETYNICIFERVKVERIAGDLYENFLNNDRETLFKYIFGHEIINRYELTIDYDMFEYTLFRDINMDCMANKNNEFINIKVDMQNDVQLKLSNVIKKLTNISSEQFRKMVDNEVISVPGVDNAKKCKIKNGTTIRLNTGELQNDLMRLTI